MIENLQPPEFYAKIPRTARNVSELDLNSLCTAALEMIREYFASLQVDETYHNVHSM
jgi:hypothetical protein